MIYSFSLSKCLLSYLQCLSYLICRICDSMEPWHRDTVTFTHLVIFLLLPCNGVLIIRPLTLVYKYCSSSCIFPSLELKFIHTETHSFSLSVNNLSPEPPFIMRLNSDCTNAIQPLFTLDWSLGLTISSKLFLLLNQSFHGEQQHNHHSQHPGPKHLPSHNCHRPRCQVP